MRNINEIIIHCTATRPEWWKTRTANQKVREVKKWHLDRGFNDIGYHYLIDRDGTVVEGRPVARSGAHVRDRNKNTIGISLFGGHGGSENDQFGDHYTSEQEAALRDLIGKLQDRFGNVPVNGHNQYAAKACPCFKVPEWFKGKKTRKSVSQSTTMQAAVGAGLSGAGGVAASVGNLDPTAQYIVLGCAGFAALFLLWIMRERIRKWGAGDR